MSNRTIKVLALTLVVAHLIVSVIHGRAHDGARVMLTTFGYLYVVLVITIVPILSGIMLLTSKQRLAGLLLALSMFGSLVFGGWYHFLSATTDNVAEVHGPWHSTFLWTAMALAVCEFAGTIIGWRIYRRP